MIEKVTPSHVDKIADRIAGAVVDSRRSKTMKFPSKEIVERLRREYPAGSRVVLKKMSDSQSPPIGTHGTIIGVDDAGSLLVKWDNGCGLNVVYGEDYAEKLDSDE